MIDLKDLVSAHKKTVFSKVFQVFIYFFLWKTSAHSTLDVPTF